MADSGTLRARRARAHKRGDHSICDPERRCEAVEAVVRSERAPEHGGRAQALLEDLRDRVEGDVMAQILLEEACRTLDRLDLLRGSAEVTAMTEARQQTAALRALLTDIRKSTGSIPAPRTAPAAQRPTVDDEDSKDGAVVDLASSLAARRAKATG